MAALIVMEFIMEGSTLPMLWVVFRPKHKVFENHLNPGMLVFLK